VCPASPARAPRYLSIPLNGFFYNTMRELVSKNPLLSIPLNGFSTVHTGSSGEEKTLSIPLNGFRFYPLAGLSMTWWAWLSIPLNGFTCPGYMFRGECKHIRLSIPLNGFRLLEKVEELAERLQTFNSIEWILVEGYLDADGYERTFNSIEWIRRTP